MSESGNCKVKIINFKIILFSLCAFHFALCNAFAASDDFRKRKPQVEGSYGETADVKAEMVFGRKLAARILGKYQLYRDKELNRYVNMVGKGVSLYAGSPEIEFRFTVLDNDMVNAFASPGGYIFITKGALKMMDDEAELAAVLAHEIAHVTERHIVKELDIKAAEDSPEAGLVRILGGGSETMRAAFIQMVDKAVDLLFEKGLKRRDEMDSDMVATMTIATAGYDASALKRYLKKISTYEEDTKILVGTHPTFEDRIKALDTLLAENQLTDKKQSIVKERFDENVKIK